MNRIKVSQSHLNKIEISDLFENNTNTMTVSYLPYNLLGESSKNTIQNNKLKNQNS